VKTLSFFLFFFLGLSVFAEDNFQHAIVNNGETLVYSDLFTTAPIGRLRRGKKIKIGKTTKNRGQIYPIVVSGRIAYVKASDLLIISSDSIELPVGHDSIVGLDLKKKSLIFSVQQYQTSWRTGAYDTTAPGQESSFSGMSLSYQYKQKSQYFYRIGYEQLSASGNNEELFIPSVTYTPVYRFWSGNKAKFNAGLSLAFSPFATYEVSPFFKLDGFAYSITPFIEHNYFFAENQFLLIHLGFRQMNLTEFAMPSIYQAFNPSFNGWQFNVAMGFNY
jgi:hypothetical protein